MKRAIAILSLFVFVISTVFSQDQSSKAIIQWSAERTVDRKLSVEQILGQDKTGFYVSKRLILDKKLFEDEGAKFLIEHYDPQMNFIRDLNLSPPPEKGKEKSLFEFVLHLDGKLYVFASQLAKNIKIRSLYMQTIDADSLQVSDDFQKIGEMNYETQHFRLDKQDFGKFAYQFSEDSSKLLIYYAYPATEHANERFDLLVFDSNMTLLWKKQVTQPYADGLFEVKDYKISNNGEVHLLASIFNKKRKIKRGGKPNYKYHLFSYSNGGQNLQRTVLESEKKFLGSMKIAITKDNEMLCIGFYSERGEWVEGLGVAGVCFFKLNVKNQKILSQGSARFSENFKREKLSSIEQAERGEKIHYGQSTELAASNISDIILKDDGSFVLIGEERAYGGIIVLKMSLTAKIEWAEKVRRKYEVGYTKNVYASYIMYRRGEQIFLLFNDAPQNINYKDGDKIHAINMGAKKIYSVLALVEIDGEGKQTKEFFFSSDYAKVTVQPRIARQLSEKGILFSAEGNKLHRFVKIKFK